MREQAEYRPVLETLNKAFGGKTWLTLQELAQHECCDVRTIRSRYRIPARAGGIDITVLALRRCERAK